MRLDFSSNPTATMAELRFAEQGTDLTTLYMTRTNESMNINYDKDGDNLGSFNLIKNSTTVMHVDNAGNVGIGTTSPLAVLHVIGDEVRIGHPSSLDYATGNGDLYVRDALEVDGTIYGTVDSTNGSFGNIQVGITTDQTLDTSAGDLVIDSD